MKKSILALVILSAWLVLAESPAFVHADSREFVEKQMRDSLNPEDVTEVVKSWSKDLGNMPLIDAAKYMKEFAESLLEMPDEAIRDTIGEAVESNGQARFMVKQIGVRRLVEYWREVADYYIQEIGETDPSEFRAALPPLPNLTVSAGMVIFLFCLTALSLRRTADKTDMRKFDRGGESNNTRLTLAETFKKYYLEVISKQYLCGSGRATRKEYWGFVFFSISVLLALILIIAGVSGRVWPEKTPLGLEPEAMAGMTVVVYVLLTLCPAWSIVVRRFHDAGLSGWFFLLTFIPYLGGLFCLAVCLLRSSPDNKYGPNKIQAAKDYREAAV